jgi:coproporphyrinogen III oxidase-like Fe-S oxidoreductase
MAGVATARNEEPVSIIKEIKERTSLSETMILGLRLLRERVVDAEFRERFEVGLSDVFRAQVDEPAGNGLMLWDGERAILTRPGMMPANNVCSRFL